MLPFELALMESSRSLGNTVDVQVEPLMIEGTNIAHTINYRASTVSWFLEGPLDAWTPETPGTTTLFGRTER
jgi:hypothetical protein